MKRFCRLALCVILAAMVILGAQSSCAAQKNPWPFVVIVTEEYKGIPWSIGSGFVFNRDQGLIVTAKHVFYPSADNAHKIKILISPASDEVREYDASVVWRHETADIGLLKIDSSEAADGLVEAPMGNLPFDGSEVRVVGFQIAALFDGGAYRLRLKNERPRIFCQREVSLIYAGISGTAELRSGASEGRGNCRGLSGGALLNGKNEAVGVLSGTITGSNAFIFFSAPLTDIPMQYWLRRK